MTEPHSPGITTKFRRITGWDRLPSLVRKFFVLLIGGTVLLIGVAMIVLPGPAFIVIPLGLLILGSEFLWARWLSERIAHKVKEARERWKQRGSTPAK